MGIEDSGSSAQPKSEAKLVQILFLVFPVVWAWELLKLIGCQLLGFKTKGHHECELRSSVWAHVQSCSHAKRSAITSGGQRVGMSYFQLSCVIFYCKLPQSFLAALAQASPDGDKTAGNAVWPNREVHSKALSQAYPTVLSLQKQKGKHKQEQQNTFLEATAPSASYNEAYTLSRTPQSPCNHTSAPLPKAAPALTNTLRACILLYQAVPLLFSLLNHPQHLWVAESGSESQRSNTKGSVLG